MRRSSSTAPESQPGAQIETPKTRPAFLPGTLDLLILKAVSLGAGHGDGVLLRIEQLTRAAAAPSTASALHVRETIVAPVGPAPRSACGHRQPSAMTLTASLRRCLGRRRHTQQLRFGTKPIGQRRLTGVRTKDFKGTPLDILLQHDLRGDE